MMNPSPYGAPPLPAMQQQPYGMSSQMRPPVPQGPGPTNFGQSGTPRYSGPPSNNYNGVENAPPSGYGPPKPGPPLQNGPPQPVNQNGSFVRNPYPNNEMNSGPPKSMAGPPMGSQNMLPRGPPQLGQGSDQLSQQMGGMSLSQSRPYGPSPPGQGSMPPRPVCPPGPPGPPGPGLYGQPAGGSQFAPSPNAGSAPRLPVAVQSGPASQFNQHQYSPMPNQPQPPNQNSTPPQNQYMASGAPMMPQNTPTPPLSSVNVGGTPTQGGPPYPGAPHPGGQMPPMPGPPMSQGAQMNGPVSSTSPYGQYPSHLQNRYPPGAQAPNKYEQFGQMPPQAPGSQSFQGSAPGAPQQPRMGGPLQQPQQARRLDPDQMPSPIQVIEDDRKNRSGDFYTNTKGQVPPLVTTNFLVHDEGICSPRFMRSTIYNVPCAPDMLKQTAVPFAVNVSPFAKLAEGEMAPPISNLGETGPVRCNRCKAYMCAFMQFIDGGRRFQCVFCKGTTEVPPEYFAHLDHTGARVDKFQRPELCLGAFEYIATKEYCRNGEFPKPPAFIFMIEVSFSTFKNGLVNLLCQNMKTILANLPKDVGQEKSAIKVGFVTYNSVIHFYNVKGTLGQPQMMVVPDVMEMFVPLVDGFLVNLEEAEVVVDSLLEQIPQMFADTRETEIVLGPVITAGLEALKAADCSGKLFIFHSSLPNAQAPGQLKNRDDRKLLGSDKEKTVLNPQTQFYNNLGQECVTASCCVDLFLFPNAYVDVASLSQVSKLTGGQIYKYAYFQADVDGDRLLEDLRRDIDKQIAFEAVLRVRTSTGIRPTDFYGNYYMANTTDVELAAIDCDKALSVEIKYDDKLTEEDGAYIQTAVLYTSCGGQRRLRILNLALNTCNQMADLYRNCELDVVVNYFAKMGLRQLMEQNPRHLKDMYISKAAQILATYRKNCASPSSVGQLILPECMKLLPLYVNCLLKNDALFGGSEMAVDDRSYAISILNSMDIYNTVGYFYPRLIPIHDLDSENDTIPNALRCSVEKVRENGAYILENGLYLFIWLGHALNSEWLQDVFAVQSTAAVNSEKPVLLELNTPMSQCVRSIVNKIKNERNRSMKMVILKQGDRLELVFRQFLVEDRSSDSSVSYVDFLCHLHKEIRNILT